MKAELVKFGPVPAHLHSDLGGDYPIVRLDVPEHAAITATRNGLRGLKYVQFWHRSARCDKFSLRFEISFANLSKVFELID